ncbi:MAG: hypothetical protein MUC42_06745, partial [Bryobacter sp.]|nr:hypothetical protein [Bryobacter sp.]
MIAKATKKDSKQPDHPAFALVGALHEAALALGEAMEAALTVERALAQNRRRLDVEENQRGQHQHGAHQRIEEELHRGVDPAVMP